MTRVILAALILAGSSGIASAHTDDRLTEIANFFSDADVVSGPEIVDCTGSVAKFTPRQR